MYLQGNSGKTDIENRLMDMRRREERVSCMERVIWKLTLPYIKETANGNLLYGSGSYFFMMNTNGPWVVTWI